MTKKINRNISLSNVLKALQSMGNVIATPIDENTTGLYKEELLFGLMTKEGLHLRSDEQKEYQVFQGKRYGKINISRADNDEFLKMATRAYWIASGKW